MAHAGHVEKLAISREIVGRTKKEAKSPEREKGRMTAKEEKP